MPTSSVPAPALVVRRERHQVEDPLDVVAEARLGEPLGGAASNEALRAGAGIDPGRLDSDDATRAGTGSGRDADQRDHLLRREIGDRRLPAKRPARDDAHLGSERLLALDDLCRDPVRQHLDEEALSEHHVVDRLVEELGEARHVDALLVAREIDGALELGGHQDLLRAPTDSDRLVDPRDACPREREPDRRRRGLEVAHERQIAHGDDATEGAARGAGP